MLHGVQEAYLDLANKTLMFLSAAAQRYEVQYIIKVDDDVYLRLDRIPHAIQQWTDIHAGKTCKICKTCLQLEGGHMRPARACMQ